MGNQPTKIESSGDKLNGNVDDKPKEVKKEIEIVIADNYDELPPKIQEKLIRTQITKEKFNDNFQILLNILNFENGRTFKFMTQKQFDLKKKPSESEHSNDRLSPRVIDKENLKKEFFSKRSANLKGEYKIVKLNNGTVKEDIKLIMGEAEKIVEVVNDELELKKKYRVFKKRGDGGFGEVFTAKDSQINKRVAVKKMEHLSEKSKRMNLCEVYYLQKCKHDNVVEYKRSHVIKSLSEMWIVMEFLEGGTLTDAVKDGYTFTENQVAYAARELLKGIEHLHSLEVCHRDIKSSNVMMSINGEIKLIDFGLCCSMKDGPKESYLGSPFWIPPEMIRKQQHSYPVDIWSFAICLIELCEGEPPHRSSSIKAMFLTGIGESPKLKPPKTYSDTIHDFLSKCLLIDPSQR
eukprot:TRINITY_DN8041_c0_g1_i2.p1 TRINITY_DN8041_c0_g1~~TRINITY_DN8041_c0_g1_i2.p1  ORF type:complete len:406 (+),score=81.11 TRINITY_DN8041_c0_g1_i2:149-1366(+)